MADASYLLGPRGGRVVTAAAGQGRRAHRRGENSRRSWREQRPIKSAVAGHTEPVGAVGPRRDEPSAWLATRGVTVHTAASAATMSDTVMRVPADLRYDPAAAVISATRRRRGQRDRRAPGCCFGRARRSMMPAQIARVRRLQARIDREVRASLDDSALRRRENGGAWAPVQPATAPRRLVASRRRDITAGRSMRERSTSEGVPHRRA